MMSGKKNYFAQNNKLDATNHRAKYFHTLDEAKAWLEEQGGGTIKLRNGHKIVPMIGKPFRVWKDIMTVKGKTTPQANEQPSLAGSGQ
jgi:hypothetical protein